MATARTPLAPLVWLDGWFPNEPFRASPEKKRVVAGAMRPLPNMPVRPRASMLMEPVEKAPTVVDQQQSTVIRFLPGAICTTPKEVIRYLAGSRYKEDARLNVLLPAAIDQAIHLSSPVFIYALHRVKALDNRGRLILENGLCLEVPKAEREPDTRYLASCVCSLGEALEDTCRRLNRQGQLLQAMLLDATGVSLLDGLVNKSHEQLRQRAREMELFAGCPFGPGFQDMSLETQSLLFQLVDAAAIQVKLNEGLVMQPMKSLSFFVRLGAKESPVGPVSKCRRCNLEHCQFRLWG